MKSHQLIAVSLLGLVSQTIAVPLVANLAHAPAPAIRDAIDSTPAGAVVKFSDTHDQYMESRKEVDRFRAQVTPLDTAPIPFTFRPEDDQVESSHIGESADFIGFESLPSNDKVNRKVYDVGSQAIPERELWGAAGHAGHAGKGGKGGKGGKKRAGNSGSAPESSASFSYMVSLIGLLVNLPFLGRLFPH